MNFLNQALLWGLAAVSLPVVIHLLNRRRFRKVPWAAMRFLKVSVEQNQRRMKLEDWILLLVRCAMIALLAFLMSYRSQDDDDSGSLVKRAHSYCPMTNAACQVDLEIPTPLYLVPIVNSNWSKL